MMHFIFRPDWFYLGWIGLFYAVVIGNVTLALINESHSEKSSGISSYLSSIYLFSINIILYIAFFYVFIFILLHFLMPVLLLIFQMWNFLLTDIWESFSWLDGLKWAGANGLIQDMRIHVPGLHTVLNILPLHLVPPLIAVIGLYFTRSIICDPLTKSLRLN